MKMKKPPLQVQGLRKNIEQGNANREAEAR